MKYIEVSSGAVIIRTRNTTREVLLIRDMKGMLTFPKGFVEKGESIIEAARREAHEETGISRLRYKATLPPVSYLYTRANRTIHKTVFYALFSSTSCEKLVPQKEEGISEIQWVPLQDACAMIGYPKSNKPIIDAVMNLL
jgi:8-oxo-dGTP pyrophosphatase MutT (NUDIX family)